MTFGQQPQNNGQYNPQYNTSDYNTCLLYTSDAADEL